MTIHELHEITARLRDQGHGECEVIISKDLAMVPANKYLTSFEEEKNPKDSCLVIRDSSLGSPAYV